MVLYENLCSLCFVYYPTMKQSKIHLVGTLLVWLGVMAPSMCWRLQWQEKKDDGSLSRKRTQYRGRGPHGIYSSISCDLSFLKFFSLVFIHPSPHPIGKIKVCWVVTKFVTYRLIQTNESNNIKVSMWKRCSKLDNNRNDNKNCFTNIPCYMFKTKRSLFYKNTTNQVPCLQMIQWTPSWKSLLWTPCKY